MNFCFHEVESECRLCYQKNHKLLYILKCKVKDTVRPDLMRVEPLDRHKKGHQPLKGFDFLISVLNI
jgi:hypothetical protein